MNLEKDEIEQSLDKKSRNRMWLIYGGRLVMLAVTIQIDLMAVIGGIEFGLSNMMGLLLSMIYTVVVLGVSTGSSPARKAAAVFSIFWALYSALAVVSSIGYIESMLLSVIELAFAVLTAITLLIDKRVNAYLDTLIKVDETSLVGDNEEEATQE